MEQQANVLLFPQVVKTIFQVLPARTLCKVSRVCTLWRHQAQLVLRQRRQICWNFFDSREKLVKEQVGDVSKQFLDYIKELPFLARRMVIFMSSSIQKSETKFSERENEETTVQLLKKLVPPDTQIVISVAQGVIGTTCAMRTEEKENRVALSVLCFGDVPGIDIVPARQIGSESSDDDELDLVDYIYTNFNDPVRWPSVSNVQAIMLLTSVSHWVDKDDRPLMQKHSKPLLFGGFVDSVFTTQPFPYLVTSNLHRYKDEEPDHRHVTEMVDTGRDCRAPFLYTGAVGHIHGEPLTQFLMFSGPDIRVASVKLADEVRLEKDVETAVLRLKEKTADFPLNHSFAFMVACVARGKHIFGKSNSESTIFRKHFPNTPLLGFFANGEIGMEYPFQANERMALMNGYTTFFTIICLPSNR